MAGRGPAPKAARQRDRDTRRSHAGEVRLPRDGKLRGPSLEDATRRYDWSDQTRDWWADWQRAPMAAAFEDTEWRRLAMLAVLVEGYYKRPSAAAMSEIRLNEERLGALFVDRQRARMVIEDEPEPEPETAVQAANVRSIRDRLG